MSTSVVVDTSALTGRSLKHILRSPDTIITTAVMLIAIMLLFVYVFGGAIQTGTASYVDYLLPGRHDRDPPLQPAAALRPPPRASTVEG